MVKTDMKTKEMGRQRRAKLEGSYHRKQTVNHLGNKHAYARERNLCRKCR